MKKLLFSIAILLSATLIASAQDNAHVVKNEKTVKKTSTVPQKVHNTFSKKKKYNGTKTKQVKTVEKTTTK